MRYATHGALPIICVQYKSWLSQPYGDESRYSIECKDKKLWNLF